MWITSKAFELIEQLRGNVISLSTDCAYKQGEVSRLEVENARLRSDIDWFKLRLNQVEKERAQLILAATGSPISYPTFTPAQEDPMKALNEMPDFAMVGADAPENYEQMPKRDRN